MSEALYNDAIVAEAKAGFGAGRLDAPTVSVRCDNPLCGDRITLDLEVADGRVDKTAHQTRGCLLTRAAASLLARHLAEAPLTELSGTEAMVERFLRDGTPVPDWPELSMFAPVRAVKSRHQCVLLPFTALEEALRELGKR